MMIVIPAYIPFKFEKVGIAPTFENVPNRVKVSEASNSSAPQSIIWFGTMLTAGRNNTLLYAEVVGWVKPTT